MPTNSQFCSVLISGFPDSNALKLARHLLDSGFGVFVSKHGIPDVKQLANGGFFAVFLYASGNGARVIPTAKHLFRSKCRPLLIVIDPDYCSNRCIAHLTAGFDACLPLAFAVPEIEIRLKNFIKRQRIKGGQKVVTTGGCPEAT